MIPGHEELFKRVTDQLVLEEGSTSSIYFLEAKGCARVKIGRTTNLIRRVGALKSISPVPLLFLGCVPGGAFAERYLHKRFFRARIKGEWYFQTPELVTTVDRILAANRIDLDVPILPVMDRRYG